MKRTHSIKPIPLGEFIAEGWRVPIKPARRSVQAQKSNGRKRMVRPGEQQSVVCGFCGNTIGLVYCAAPATANRRVRR